MTKAQKIEAARRTCGFASGLLGVTGFMREDWTFTYVALAFALAWLILCVIGVNSWVDDEVERIAPRHRKEK